MRTMTIKYLKYRMVFAILIATIPSVSSAQAVVSITIAPPLLPVYVQPVCPAPGYMWAPGYWAWTPVDAEYYWVPGTWVEPPSYGLLWTPGYWGWDGGFYRWHPGYWGNHIGFYGGVVYGFGYDGIGFHGGHWNGREFYYNRRVANVNVNTFRNVYDRPVILRNKTRVSYNGSHGGIALRPTREQLIFADKTHLPGTALQTKHARRAARRTELRASVNHGRPPVAASPKAGIFNGNNITPAEGATDNSRVRPQSSPPTPAHRKISTSTPHRKHVNHRRQLPAKKANPSPNMFHPNKPRPAKPKDSLMQNRPKPSARPGSPRGSKIGPKSKHSPKKPR